VRCYRPPDVSENAREEIESAARAERAAHAPETVHKQEEKAHRDVRYESLTGASKGNPIILAIGIPLIGVVMMLVFVVLPMVTKSAWPMLVGIPALVGVMYLVGWGLTRWLAAMRASVVRRIGHGFNANAYLDALSQKRRSGRLVTIVRFNDAWDGELRRSTTDAIRQWCPAVKDPRWDGDRVLHLDTDSTPLVETYRKGKFARVTKFTNFPLHAVMRKITRRVLPRLHAVHPIASFEAKITGNICAILEDP
jgi:hypothetical protein